MKAVNLKNGLCYIPAIAEVSLSDDIMRPVGIMFELLDTREFDDKADDTYPYIVSASLMLDTVNPAFDESGGHGEDAYHYCGGVPVDHILQDEVKLPGAAPLFSRFTIEEAKKVTTRHVHGTIAAQRGAGAEYTHLQFSTVAAAEKYANALLENAAGLSIMVGFILDRPVNMAGHDGWKTITLHANGPTVYGKGE